MKYLLALVIVTALASSGRPTPPPPRLEWDLPFAIHCYNCDTKNFPNCSDPFKADEKMTTDCSSSLMLSLMNKRDVVVTGCLKITAKSGIQVMRTCDFGDLSTYKTLTDKISINKCVGNLCNDSTLMAPVAVSIVTLFGLARLFS